ncbi:protein-export chaperone SecB [Flagellimonas sp.]|uniref:protein-export chaperone SecB n=1 Tax=Flagellimonas sp. TaxID=2058762 RepID=UPI003AB875AA
MEKASFSLIDYAFDKVLIEGNYLQKDSSIEIMFNPSGIFDPETSDYTLTFVFKAITEKKMDKPFIEVRCIAVFKIDNVTEINEIPNYFYRNSIAILFPYVRAYISLVTNQANIKPFILPTLNLSELETPLRENTISK